MNVKYIPYKMSYDSYDIKRLNEVCVLLTEMGGLSYDILKESGVA